ncbi:PREDICTED: UDP-glucuronate 4-epimerase 4-like [Branchiostoma belcheri]|uniref:UDP-glucuronate 4-epimerase 4-like n=1 Tax=Branchiostoma belcheri TaxID=7741 RepID=A0A6P4XXH6_BRABE|nr:PREDICTED: UDP-glucuronate 4-epimerase 4-like [Branchiostoma belcheri]
MLSRPVLITAVGISCILFLYTVTRTGHIPGTVEPPIPGAQTDSPKHVLVTGAAGFVGFHLSKALLDKPHARVFGVDNFDKWSDLKLKQDRAHELYEYGVALEDGDICDQEYLTDLFRRENFTHVVHLAGRSGVRGQDLDAAAIMENNVECFVNLLEVMKNYKNIKLVYASSASVYGSSSQLPFSPSHHVLQPDTIEGLAKRTGELLAQGYCKEYGLHQVGLRFFTVYGPWGREDSALNIFTQQMLEGEVLQVFHTREGRPLERDFLYVEDAVRGVLSALDFSPTHCGHVFNLASGQAQSAVDLVALLEQQLNIQAQAGLMAVKGSYGGNPDA